MQADQRLIWGLAFITLICGTSLLYTRSIDRRLERFEAGFIAAAQRIAALEGGVRETRGALLRIEEALAKAGYKAELDRLHFPELDTAHGAIKPGLYVFESELRLRDSSGKKYFTEKFTVYNIKALLGGTGPAIMLGIAVAGVDTLPVFYLDSDLDNRVDLEVMQDVVSMIPMGRALKRTIDQENAQTIYNGFLRDYKTARYISLEDIENSGYSVAAAAFKFINEHSASLLDLGPADKQEGREEDGDAQ